MRKLPHCSYPRAADIAQHGLQPLPAELLIMNLEAAESYRSKTCKAIVIDKFSHQQVIELARMFANSFVVNEPMARHIQRPRHAPTTIHAIKRCDELGKDDFGNWLKENIFFWMTRLFFLTDPAAPIIGIKLTGGVLTHSLAILNDRGKIIGGALNLPLHEEQQPLRDNDPFLNAVYSWFKPIHRLLVLRDEAALDHLATHYPNFKTALEKNKAGIFLWWPILRWQRQRRHVLCASHQINFMNSEN